MHTRSSPEKGTMPGALDRLLAHINSLLSLVQRRFERRHYQLEGSNILKELLQSRSLITKSVKLFNKRVDLEEVFKWNRPQVL